MFTDDGLALAQAEIDQATAAVRLAREFGRHALLYTDLARYTGKLDVTLGVARYRTATSTVRTGDWAFITTAWMTSTCRPKAHS